METTLEIQLQTVMEQAVKARVFAAMTSLATVYSHKGTVTGTSEHRDMIRAINWHTKLMNIVRNPYIVRRSLLELLDDIEDEYPVPLDMDITWITQHNGSIPDFVTDEIIKHIKR